jgi:hypothetical protein
MIIKDMLFTILTLIAQIALLLLWLPYKAFELLYGVVYREKEETPVEKPKKAKKTKKTKKTKAEKVEEKEQALEKQFLDYGEMK